MEERDRKHLVRQVLDGYASGTDAPIEATAEALSRAASARAVVLVEGISDQMALEALAERHQRDLGAEGVVVIPIGGAQAVTRFLLRFGPQGSGTTVLGLCDAGEERYVRRALQSTGFGPVDSRPELERCGFFVCERDLEDELIRAAGQPTIEAQLRSHGDLASFETLRRQPAWRAEGFEPQLRRWLGAGAGRKLRYARLLVLAIPLNRIPRPLGAVLARTVIR